MVNKSINVKEACFPDFSAGDKSSGKSSEDYTNLLMDVPLNVRVEIGKAKLKMRDVLNLAQGSIIRLEKQAGAPVEIVANNRTVARGDVIVIDDNFGVRITEIISDRKFVKDLEKSSAKNNSLPESSSAPESAVNEGISEYQDAQPSYRENEENQTSDENEE